MPTPYPAPALTVLDYRALKIILTHTLENLTVGSMPHGVVSELLASINTWLATQDPCP